MQKYNLGGKVFYSILCYLQRQIRSIVQHRESNLSLTGPDPHVKHEGSGAGFGLCQSP